MTTTVTKVIGTGGDYSTVQAWEDATPANLVTADQIWRGECKNQTFATVTFGGTTADATRYSELTTQSGASFRDNVNAQTNALRVNTSNGATLRTTSSYTVVCSLSDFVRLSNLQLEIAGAVGGTTTTVNTNASATSVDINNCLIEANRSGVLNLLGSGVVLRNSLIVGRGSGFSTIASLRGGVSAVNCTFAVPSDKTAYSTAITGQYTAATLKNCAIFGVSALSTGTTPTYTTCATNISGTTGVTGSVAYSTATFANVTDATRDFKLVTGSALLDVGTTDSTNAATDVVGTSRPQSTGYDIGAWELVVAAGGNTISVPAGSLTLSGFAPTIVQTANNVIAVPAGTLTLTGQTPTVTASDHKTIAVPAGSLTLTGQTPTVVVGSPSDPQTISVPAGGLTLTGFAPTILQTANNVVQVPAGTLTLTGLTPTVTATANNVIAVPAGTLTLSPFAPVVNPVAQAAPTTPVVGGGPAPRKRHFVQVDDELFEVADQQEAVEILQQAQELHAEVVRKSVVSKTKPPAKPVVKASVSVVDTQKAMEAAQAEAERAFQQMLDDDDEDVLLLL